MTAQLEQNLNPIPEEVGNHVTSFKDITES